MKYLMKLKSFTESKTHIKTFEYNFPFFKNKDEHIPYVEIPVNLLGQYIYNNKTYEIKQDDITNLGVIRDIKSAPQHGVNWMIITIDNYNRFWISNPPKKIYIIKGDEISKDINKYNL